MRNADVVITGVGMVTSLGTTARETAEAWRTGGTFTSRPLPDLAGTPLENAHAGMLAEFDAAMRLGGRKTLKYMSHAAMLGCVAAREAALDARLRERFRGEDAGLFAATGLAAADAHQALPLVRESIDHEGHFSTRLLGQRGLPATDPLLSFRILANMPACLISIQEGIRGPSYIFTPWEGQTGAALREAWRAVASGEVAAAITGAADTPAHPATFVYLRQSGVLRGNDVPSDAASYLVLERAETAVRDSQRIYAQLESVEVAETREAGFDPLRSRMGCAIAASPAVLLALAAQLSWPEVSLCGSDGSRIVFRLGKAA